MARDLSGFIYKWHSSLNHSNDVFRHDLWVKSKELAKEFTSSLSYTHAQRSGGVLCTDTFTTAANPPHDSGERWSSWVQQTQAGSEVLTPLCGSWQHTDTVVCSYHHNLSWHLRLCLLCVWRRLFTRRYLFCFSFSCNCVFCQWISVRRLGRHSLPCHSLICYEVWQVSKRKQIYFPCLTIPSICNKIPNICNKLHLTLFISATVMWWFMCKLLLADDLVRLITTRIILFLGTMPLRKGV